MSANLVPLNPEALARHARGTQELAVSTYLEQARTWLATAVEQTSPEHIVETRARLRSIEDFARNFELSKDIQRDAGEMVRRSEYELAQAIRAGQASGAIARQGQSRSFRTDLHLGDTEVKKRIDDIVPYSEWQSGGAAPGIAALADVDRDDFEDAVTAARAEGNTSRSNVVRKIKAKTSPSMTREGRAAEMADLADQGYTSRQIAERLGIGFKATREIARDFDIDVPADRVVGKQRRIDHTQVVDSTVTDLENTAEFIEAHVDLSQVDFTEADEWVSSLTNSIRVLKRFVKQIQEKTHV